MHKLDKKTLAMLRNWKNKYGLDVIEDRLDSGLFHNDKAMQQACYAWIRAQRAAPVILLAVKFVFGLAVFLGAIASVIAVFK
ncbi:MAG: hypothetical protein WC322_00340 [Candidatus Paceibacterota bacterium]|jgi:hypothetical protein